MDKSGSEVGVCGCPGSRYLKLRIALLWRWLMALVSKRVKRSRVHGVLRNRGYNLLMAHMVSVLVMLRNSTNSINRYGMLGNSSILLSTHKVVYLSGTFDRERREYECMH
jgi:dolichyl-phosphate-mannose--protein O-mannosyl transferase